MRPVIIAIYATAVDARLDTLSMVISTASHLKPWLSIDLTELKITSTYEALWPNG